MAITIAPPPVSEALNQQDGKDWKPIWLAKRWAGWLQEQNGLIPRVQAAPQWLKTVTLSGQHAAIGATAIPMAVLAAGRYQVSWYVRVTTPASVTSSVAVTIGWTEGAVALTLSGAAVTGNLTTSVQSGVVFLLVDRATSITYSTGYASNAAGMNYELTIDVVQMS